MDTRTLKPGDIFIPIKGESFDGHDFIQEAYKKGASKVIDKPIADIARAYRKKLNCPILAITGSFGKTTMKDMCKAVLKQRFPNLVATKENQNNEIGVPLTILQADANTDLLIVELGMRKPGDIAYLTQILRPTHALITGIGLTHIEFFKSQKHLAMGKAELFRRPLNWEKKQRTAFLNNSSPYYRQIEEKAKSKAYKCLSYTGETGPEQNLNAAYLIGQHFGLSDAQIKQGVSEFQGSEHRLRHITLPQITVIDDAYNANPDAMRYALSVLKRQEGRKIAVLGEMKELGSHSKREHQALEHPLIDAQVEQVYTIGEEIKALRSSAISITHCPDKQHLHQQLLAELKPGDTVLIKGSRGARLEETVEVLSKVWAT